jgi:hypothetical protein
MAAKYLCYAILFFLGMFFLELFEIVDVPFFDLPDFLTERNSLIDKTTEGLDEIKY